jgi:hypothetical protein
MFADASRCFRSEGNGHPDGFRSKSRIEGPAALSWRLGQVEPAPVGEKNLFKIDHLLIILTLKKGTN